MSKHKWHVFQFHAIWRSRRNSRHPSTWKTGARPRFNIKMLSYQNRKYHCGDKTVVRSSYLHIGISYTGETVSLYWIVARVILHSQFNSMAVDGMATQEVKGSAATILTYRKVSNIRRTQNQNLNDSRLNMLWPLPNQLKPGVKSRMKM